MKNIFFLSQINHYSLRVIASVWKMLLLGIVISSCLIFLSGCQGIVQKDDGVIHLTLWQAINPPTNRDVFEKLVDKFNQTHPDIQVESVFLAQPQLPKILTAVVGNAPPDILAFYPQITGQLADLRAIIPLEDWLEKLPLKSEIRPNLLEELRLDGHLWSAPLYTSNIGIFYRPKLFEAAGITQMPKTWEELRQVAKKLTIDPQWRQATRTVRNCTAFGEGRMDSFELVPFFIERWWRSTDK